MRSESRFLERGRARLHFVSEGQGPVVVLIHGWALDLEMWRPQVPVLAERYRVIALDRRGFGRSTGEPSIAEDVLDVHMLLNALDVRRAALLGMSQGARVVLRYAMHYPGNTSCAIFDGPPRNLASDTEAHIDAHTDAMTGEIPMAMYRDLARKIGIEAFRSEWSGHPLMKLHTSDARTRELLQEIVSRYPGRDLMRDSPQSKGPSLSLAPVKLPCLVINGSEDSQERRSTGQTVADEMSAERVAVIPGAGHLPNLDNPVAYNAALMQFLNTHAAPVAGAFAS